MSQIPLKIQRKENISFDNFLPGKNIEFINTLKQSIDKQDEQFIYFWGQSAVGKSHLSQAICQYYKAQGKSSILLPLKTVVGLDISILDNIENNFLICIDDLQGIAQNPVWEEAIFNLFNETRLRGIKLFISADKKGADIGLLLPNLISRLQWGLIYQVHELNDDEKIQVLINRTQLRGIHLSDKLAQYILTHHRRNMSELAQFLDILDYASLAEKKKLTIAFVKKIMQSNEDYRL